MGYHTGYSNAKLKKTQITSDFQLKTVLDSFKVVCVGDTPYHPAGTELELDSNALSHQTQQYIPWKGLF